MLKSIPICVHREKPIRIALKGMAGLLGSRIVLAIAKNPDLKLTVGIVKDDPTLRKLLYSLKSAPEHIMKSILPDELYLDEKHKKVKEVNSDSPVELTPADQLNLSTNADLIIDASAPGCYNSWAERYLHFSGPIILQSGEYPVGRLISPPLVEKGASNIYRQGDCILSGTIPVLAHLASLAEKMYIHILTQYSNKLYEYTTDMRLGSTYSREDIEPMINSAYSTLLPNLDYSLLGISQVSGLSYYTISLLLDLKKPMKGIEIKELLKTKPRILVIPNITSTHDIAYNYKERLIALGKNIPPIVVFGSELDSTNLSSQIRIKIAIDYRYITSLPNIDAIRMLLYGLDGESSMRITDQNMQF